MRRVEYQYEVETVLEFTRQEIEYLIALASLHYDAKCRSVAKPGIGSFLHGMAVAMGEDSAVIRALSFRDLDLLCKITEQESQMMASARAAVRGGFLQVSRPEVTVCGIQLMHLHRPLMAELEALQTEQRMTLR